MPREDKAMDSMELLVSAVVGVICVLAIAAAVAYKIADRYDKQHHTDIKAR